MKGTRTWKLMVVLVVIFVSETKMAAWAEGTVSGSQQCQDELQQGINACIGVVMGLQPSPACCVRVQITHLECVCPKVTPEIAAMIDPKRIKKLAEGCGRKLPSHFKCGSLTIP